MNKKQKEIDPYEGECPECGMLAYNVHCQYCNENRYLPKEDKQSDKMIQFDLERYVERYDIDIMIMFILTAFIYFLVVYYLY